MNHNSLKIFSKPFVFELFSFETIFQNLFSERKHVLRYVDFIKEDNHTIHQESHTERLSFLIISKKSKKNYKDISERFDIK